MSTDIGTLVGRTLHTVKTCDLTRDGDCIVFTATTGERWKMYHQGDCCESVTIEDVTGDMSDLVGHEILVAEERESDESTAYATAFAETGQGGGEASHTWTYYEFRTVVGSVTIRWYGESNGYYSESVDFGALEHHEPADADIWTVAGDKAKWLGSTVLADRYAAYFALGGT